MTKALENLIQSMFGFDLYSNLFLILHGANLYGSDAIPILFSKYLWIDPKIQNKFGHGMDPASYFVGLDLSG